MPKKFGGENSKSAAARARKSAAKELEDTRRQQQLEDAYWKDDDKHAARKQQRKVWLNLRVKWNLDADEAVQIIDAFCNFYVFFTHMGRFFFVLPIINVIVS